MAPAGPSPGSTPTIGAEDGARRSRRGGWRRRERDEQSRSRQRHAQPGARRARRVASAGRRRARARRAPPALEPHEPGGDHDTSAKRREDESEHGKRRREEHEHRGHHQGVPDDGASLGHGFRSGCPARGDGIAQAARISKPTPAAQREGCRGRAWPRCRADSGGPPAGRRPPARQGPGRSSDRAWPSAGCRRRRYCFLSPDLLHQGRDLPVITRHEPIEVPRAEDLDAGAHPSGELAELSALSGPHEGALEPSDGRRPVRPWARRCRATASWKGRPRSP